MFRGAKLQPKKEHKDLGEDASTENATKQQLENRVKAVQGKIVVNQKLNSSATGKDAGLGAGGMWLEELINYELAPKVDWKKVLKDRMVKAHNTFDSYSSINKRYIHMGKKLPGAKPADPTQLENVYVCIDTSGSMGYKELCTAFTHILRIMKMYKDTKVKVIYWDSEVEAVYDKIDKNTLGRAKPAGGGGTNVNCVFRYLEKNDDDFKPHKKNTPRKRQNTIMIFTDGCFFEPLREEYAKAYEAEIIWVLNPEDYKTSKDRKDLVGVVAPLEIES